jgi:hypothetical protein
MLYSGWVCATLLRRLGSWRIPLAVGAIGFTLLFTSVTFVNRKLSGDRRAHYLQTIFLYDLTKISLSERRNLLTGWVRQNGSVPTLDELQRMYQPEGIDLLFWGDPTMNLQTTADSVRLATLAQTWRAAVFRFPFAYARHRLNVLSSILGMVHTCYPYQEDISENSFGIHVRPSRINAVVMKVLARFRNTLFFKPWLYIVAIALMLIASHRLPTSLRTPAMILGISALLYEGPYLFVGPGCDFRLSWYVVLTALVMPSLLILASARRRECATYPGPVSGHSKIHRATPAATFPRE